MNRFLPLAAFLIATFGAAAIGSSATFRSVATWYPTLLKPNWTPPDSWFGPVWAVLYCAMAVAGWRVWRQTAEVARRSQVALYAVQLVLNAFWSVFFFGLRRPGLALIDLVALWLLLVVLLARYWRIDRPAGLLWTPYVLWTSFALALNAAIWQLNR